MSLNALLLCTWWPDFRQTARVWRVHKCNDGTVRPCTCTVTPVRHMTDKSYTLRVTYIENCCLITWESVDCKLQKHHSTTNRQSLTFRFPTFVQPILSCVINSSLPSGRWIRTSVHSWRTNISCYRTVVLSVSQANIQSLCGLNNSTVGSHFTTGLLSRIFGRKSRRKTSAI
jgi:hypothetical protein